MSTHLQRTQTTSYPFQRSSTSSPTAAKPVPRLCSPFSSLHRRHCRALTFNCTGCWPPQSRFPKRSRLLPKRKHLTGPRHHPVTCLHQHLPWRLSSVCTSQPVTDDHHLRHHITPPPPLSAHHGNHRCAVSTNSPAPEPRSTVLAVASTIKQAVKTA